MEKTLPNVAGVQVASEEVSNINIIQDQTQVLSESIRTDPLQLPGRCDVQDVSYNTVRGFGERWIQIKSFAWSPTDARGKQLFQCELPFFIFDKFPNWPLSKLASQFRYIAYDYVDIRLQLDANPFAQGMLLGVVYPQAYVQNNLSAHFQLIESLATMVHTRVNANESTSGELEVPFVHFQSWATISGRDDDANTRMVRLGVYVMNPLYLADETIVVNVSIYCRLRGVRFGGPTVTSALQGAVPRGLYQNKLKLHLNPKGKGSLESQGPTLSVLRTGNRVVGSVLENIPGNADLPSMPENPMKMVHRNYPSLSLGAGVVEVVDKLSLTSTCVTSADYLGVQEGKCTNFRDITSIWGLFTTVKLDVSQDTGTVLWSTPICLPLNRDGIIPLCYVANLFRYWRGDLEFRSDAICTRYHKARVAYVWNPGGGSVSGLKDMNQCMFFQQEIGNNNSLSFVVPYTNNAAMAEKAYDMPMTTIVTNNSTVAGRNITYRGSQVSMKQMPSNNMSVLGTLSLIVVNKLVVPKTVNSSVEFNIWVRGCSNLELALILPSPYLELPITPWRTEGAFDFSNEEAITVAPARQCVRDHLGEDHMDILTFCKRKVCLFNGTLDFAGTSLFENVGTDWIQVALLPVSPSMCFANYPKISTNSSATIDDYGAYWFEYADEDQTRSMNSARIHNIASVAKLFRMFRGSHRYVISVVGAPVEIAAFIVPCVYSEYINAGMHVGVVGVNPLLSTGCAMLSSSKNNVLEVEVPMISRFPVNLNHVSSVFKPSEYWQKAHFPGYLAICIRNSSGHVADAFTSRPFRMSVYYGAGDDLRFYGYAGVPKFDRMLDGDLFDSYQYVPMQRGTNASPLGHWFGLGLDFNPLDVATRAQGDTIVAVSISGVESKVSDKPKTVKSPDALIPVQHKVSSNLPGGVSDKQQVVPSKPTIERSPSKTSITSSSSGGTRRRVTVPPPPRQPVAVAHSGNVSVFVPTGPTECRNVPPGSIYLVSRFDRDAKWIELLKLTDYSWYGAAVSRLQVLDALATDSTKVMTPAELKQYKDLKDWEDGLFCRLAGGELVQTLRSEGLFEIKVGIQTNVMKAAQTVLDTLKKIVPNFMLNMFSWIWARMVDLLHMLMNPTFICISLGISNVVISTLTLLHSYKLQDTAEQVASAMDTGSVHTVGIVQMTMGFFSSIFSKQSEGEIVGVEEGPVVIEEAQEALCSEGIDESDISMDNDIISDDLLALSGSDIYAVAEKEKRSKVKIVLFGAGLCITIMETLGRMFGVPRYMMPLTFVKDMIKKFFAIGWVKRIIPSLIVRYFSDIINWLKDCVRAIMGLQDPIVSALNAYDKHQAVYKGYIKLISDCKLRRLEGKFEGSVEMAKVLAAGLRIPEITDLGVTLASSSRTRSVGILLMGLSKDLQEWSSRARMLNQNQPFREDPYVIVLSGYAGVGKTAMASIVASEVLLALGCNKTAANIYTKQDDQVEFMNGYTGQEALIIEDMNAVAESKTAALLMNLKNNSRVNVNMANVDEKEQISKVKVIVVTTNLEKYVNPAIRKADAFLRRLNKVMVVTNNGKLTPDIIGKGFPNHRFMVDSKPGEPGKVEGVVYNFREMMEHLIHDVVTYMRKQHDMVRATLEIVNGVGLGVVDRSNKKEFEALVRSTLQSQGSSDEENVASSSKSSWLSLKKVYSCDHSQITSSWRYSLGMFSDPLYCNEICERPCEGGCVWDDASVRYKFGKLWEAKNKEAIEQAGKITLGVFKTGERFPPVPEGQWWYPDPQADPRAFCCPLWLIPEVSETVDKPEMDPLVARADAEVANMEVLCTSSFGAWGKRVVNILKCLLLVSGAAGTVYMAVKYLLGYDVYQPVKDLGLQVVQNMTSKIRKVDIVENPVELDAESAYSTQPKQQLRPVAVKRLQAEGGSEDEMRNLIHRLLLRNVVFVRVGGAVIRMLGVNDRWALCTKHELKVLSQHWTEGFAVYRRHRPYLVTGPCEVRYVENRDVAVIRFPDTVDKFHNIIPQFISLTDIVPDMSMEAILCKVDLEDDNSIAQVNYWNVRAKHCEKMITAGHSNDYPAGSAVLNVWQYYGVQGKMYCGSILANTKQSKMLGRIMGIHIAGQAGVLGVSACIPRETLERLCSGVEVSMRNLEDTVPLVDEEQSRYAIPIGMDFCGVVSHGVNMNDRSDYEESLFFDQVYPHQTAPSVLSPSDPRLAEPVSPLYKNLEKLSVKDSGRSCGPQAYNHLLSKTMNLVPWEKPSIWEQNLAINGNGLGVEPLDMTTSEGYPFLLRRSSNQHNKRWMFEGEPGHYVIGDKELGKNYYEYIHLEPGDEYRVPIFVGCLKSEKLSLAHIEKGKTRMFFGCPVDFCLFVRSIYGDFMDAFIRQRKDLFHRVGIDPMSLEWTEMCVKHASVSSEVLEADWSAYDTSVSRAHLMKVDDIIYEWYRGHGASSHHLYLLKVAADAMQNAHVLVGNVVFRMQGGQPSGNPMTTIRNCLANCLYWNQWIFDCWGRAVLHSDMWYLTVYGDDVLLSLSPDLENLSVYTKKVSDYMMNRFDMVLTFGVNKETSGSLQPLLGASFLRRSIAEHPTRPGLYVGKLNRVSIQDVVNWVKRSEDPVATLVSNVYGISRDMYAYGPQVYMEEFILPLTRVAYDRRITLTIPTWEDWDQLLFD